ncbi:extracellular solute-binding protein [Martelella sp. FOR1707]
MALELKRRKFLEMTGALVGTTALAPRFAAAQTAAISYWHHFASQTEIAGLDKVLALYKEQGGGPVRPESIPNVEYMAKMTTAVIANSRPDTGQVIAERFADLYAMGALVDLTDRIDTWPLKDDFPDNRWDGVRKDGKLYGVPAFAFVDWIYYRKDWFDEAGIAPPTTFAEFRDAAIAMTDPSKNRYGFGMRGGPLGQKFVIDLMEAYGSPVMTDGEISMNREAAIEALQFWAGLYTRDHAVPPSAPNDAYRQLIEGFTTGQTAMVWHHTGSLQEISAALEPGVEFGTFPVPRGPAAHVSRVAYAYNGIMSEEHMDAAWDWISFWGHPDAAVAFMEETGYFPASRSATADPRIADNPIYQAATETLEFGTLPPSFPGFAGWGENTVLPDFQAVLVGNMTEEQAVDDMIDKLQQAVQ